MQDRLSNSIDPGLVILMTAGASACVADVSNVAMVDSLFRELEERYGALDVLVNNAGVDGHTETLSNVMI